MPSLSLSSTPLTPSLRSRHLTDEGSLLFYNPLFAVKWQRIVLDEAHRIRSHKSQTADACSALDATYRWALTGTPIHNKANDFYSLLRYLHYSPFDVYSTWKLFSSNQYKSIERLKTIVRSLILRRTKADHDHHGRLLVPLPSKQIEDLWLTLSDEEMKHYQRIRTEMTDAYKLFIRNRREKKKTNTVVLFSLMSVNDSTERERESDKNASFILG